MASQLEIRNLQRLTAEELEAASVYGDAEMALADRLHRWLHEQMGAMTTPPYFWWIFWSKVRLASTWSSLRMAIELSSQELSIARIKWDMI